MVSKKRTVKTALSDNKPEILSIPSVDRRDTLQLLVNNPNPIVRELELLDFESSLLSTQKLPLITVNSIDVKTNRSKPFHDSTCDLKNSASCIHLLPHSGSWNENEKTIVQNYVYIPHKYHNCALSKLPPPLTSHDDRGKSDSKTEIAKEAKREASVLLQINKLAKQGLWSATRLPKVMEPKQKKAHWDFLLDEICWMATDFGEERKWKKEAAKKLVYAARSYCILKQETNLHKKEALEIERRRGAAIIAAMVRQWWGNVSHTVEAWVLLTKQRRWRNIMLQNRHCITQLTDLAPTWLASAISRSLSNCSDTFMQSVEFQNSSETEDKEWVPPMGNENSTASSSRFGSFESIADTFESATVEGNHTAPMSPYSFEQFAWGIPQISLTNGIPLPSSLPQSCMSSSCPSSASISSAETDLDDVNQLTADTERPLGALLEPYFVNGWSPCSSGIQTKLPLLESGLSTIPLFLKADSSKKSIKDEHFKSPAKSAKFNCDSSILESLHLDASLPLVQILPTGYHPLSRVNMPVDNDDLTSQHSTNIHNHTYKKMPYTRRSTRLTTVNIKPSTPSTRVLRGTPLVNSLSSLARSDDDEEMSELVETIIYEAPLFEASPLDSPITNYDSEIDDDQIEELEDDHHDTESFSATSLASSVIACAKGNLDITYAPWTMLPNDNESSAVNRKSPWKLRRLAHEIAWIKRSKRPFDVPFPMPSFGPTCRIPFLPTVALYSAVSWLYATYKKRTPACLISPLPSSSDAELTLAAHLGRLAVLRPDNHEEDDNTTPSTTNKIGDWGPHLIVCPRVLLPAWRSRLAYCCPGLRIICIDSAGGFGGTGRRLRRSIAAGQVNICLTSFAAFRSRPSRYARIQWSLVILDQAQHLTSSRPSQCSSDVKCPVSVFTLKHPLCSSRSSDMSSNQSDVKPSLPLCQGDKVEEEFYWSDELVDLVVENLSLARQRILVYSSELPARLANVRTLFNLLTNNAQCQRLISAEDATDELKEQSESFVTQNIDGLSHGEVIKILDPFIFRFEEDDDWDKFVKEHIVSNPLTEQQRSIHDAILTGKSCERAVKSGHLSDLLSTVSAGARVCIHPCLVSGSYSTNYPSTFRDCLKGLLSDSDPALGPLRFPIGPDFSTPPLCFNTTPAVLEAVQRFRSNEVMGDEISESILDDFLRIPRTLSQPVHIRRRLVELLPDSDLLSTAFAERSNRMLKRTTENENQHSFKRPRMTEREEEIDKKQIAASPRGFLPFISDILFNQILLDESEAMVSPCPNNSPSKVSKISIQPAVEHIAANLLSVFGSGDEVPASLTSTSVDVNARIGHIMTQSKRLRLSLEGFSDWCCESSCNYLTFIPSSHYSRSTSPEFVITNPQSTGLSFPYLDNIWNVAQHRFDVLFSRGRSIMTNFLLCTRDAVIAPPTRLTTRLDPFISPHFSNHHLQNSNDLDLILTRLLPLLPSSRWLSRAASPLPHFSSNFIRSSGKLQSLRILLRQLLLSSDFEQISDPNEYSHPRCLFLIAHRAALLDLLEAWLPSDFQLGRLPFLRLPPGHIDESAELLASVDHVNSWPMTADKKPLIVLMHARTLFLSLAGLRAGPDTRVVICDADWRVDVTDGLRSRLRTWALNGLVDANMSHHGSSPLLHVYRLVTEADNRGDSIEACLINSPAIRLLPDSVFMTTSPAVSGKPTTAHHCQLGSRVQPNVVQELVTRLRKRAIRRQQQQILTADTFVTENWPENEDEDLEDEADEGLADDDSDTASLFQTREPLAESMLNQAFELHESTPDVQAWLSGHAETLAVEAEFHPTCCFSCVSSGQREGVRLTYNDFSDDLDERLFDGCEFWSSSKSPLHEQILSAGSEKGITSLGNLSAKMGYSKLEAWELATTNSGCDEAISETSEAISFFYPAVEDDNYRMTTLEDVNLDEFSFNDLPLWLPSNFDDAPLLGDRILPSSLSNLVDATIPFFDLENNSNEQPFLDVSSSSWGYSKEAMTESELPPISHLSSRFKDSSANVNTNITSLSPNKEQLFSSALKRSAAATLVRNQPFANSLATANHRNSIGGSSGAGSATAGLKRRKLSGAAAVASRRAAVAKTVAASASFENNPPSDDLSIPASTIDNIVMSQTPITSVELSSCVSYLSTAAISQHQQNQSCSTTTNTRTVVIALSPSCSPLKVTNPALGAIENRLHVPRPFYSRDLQSRTGMSSNSTAARIRRSGPAGLARSGHLSLNNPTLLAKYAVPDRQASSASTSGLTAGGGTQRVSGTANQGSHSSSGLISFKFGSSSINAGLLNNPSTTAGGLAIGKPPDWSLYEEAGLFQCVTRLQNLPIAQAPSQQTVAAAVNFALGEYFVNNFLPTRVYRSCRQCLLAYHKAQATISAANTAIESAAAAVGSMNCDEDKSSMLHHSSYHSSASRKMKSKLKSNVSAASLQPSASTNLLGLSNTASLGGDGLTFNASSAISRLKGYQFYQYLQSLVDYHPIEQHLKPSPFTPSPQHLAQLLHTINGAMDSQLGLLRKFVREALTTSDCNHHHHSPALSIASGGMQGLMHHQSNTTTASLSRSASASLAAATAAASSSNCMSGGMPSGPVIQKNPTHIAALQEHNISPDTLITPAMVIKNKEEREARQRSEAASAIMSGPKQQQQVSAQSQQTHHTSVSSSVATCSSSSTVQGISISASGGSLGVVPVHSINTGHRTSGVMPFSSSSAFGGIHLTGLSAGNGGGTAVLRYASPSGSISVSSLSSAGQQSQHQRPGSTGLLRRVGSATSHSQQQLYAVSASSSSNTNINQASSSSSVIGSRWLTVEQMQHLSSIPRVTSSNSSEITVVCSGSSGNILSANMLPASMAGGIARRTVSLTGTSVSHSSVGGGVTVLASARGASSVTSSMTTEGGNVVYHHPSGSSIVGSNGGCGVTLLSTGSSGGGQPQIIRPRHPLRGTNVPHKFVRTLSSNAVGLDNGPRGPVLGIHPGSTVVHRTGPTSGTGPRGIMRSPSIDQHYPVISASPPTFLSLTNCQRTDGSVPQVLSRVHPIRQPHQAAPLRRQVPPQSHYKPGAGPHTQQQYNTVLFSSSTATNPQPQQQQQRRPSQSDHNQKKF